MVLVDHLDLNNFLTPNFHIVDTEKTGNTYCQSIQKSMLNYLDLTLRKIKSLLGYDELQIPPTFLTIPLEEINKFMRQYKQAIPAGYKEPEKSEMKYRLVWQYILEYIVLGRPILSDAGYFFPSVHISDYITTYDLRNKITKKYSASSILHSSDFNLSELSRSLGLLYPSKERIIRILGYLNLLDQDMSVFDLLPKDILWLIGIKLDFTSLGAFGRISRRFNEFFVVTDELKEMARIHLQDAVPLDLTHYTKKQLGLLGRRNHQVGNLSTGQSHSLVLNSHGQVYSFGDDEYGQLSLGDRDDNLPISTPNPIITDIRKIIAISAGGRHTLFLNAKGQAFGCGSNTYGQLGFRNGKNQSTPIWIMIPAMTDDITAISAGGNHSLLLNSQGRVYSCGANGHGQLGLVDFEDPHGPNLIRISDIIAISAGGDHSLLLNIQGQVYSFGSNDYGQLGLGDRKTKVIPTLIENYGDHKIIATSAGFRHFLLLTSQGLVLSFGSNICGQLGHGHNHDQNYPCLITNPGIGKVVVISAGYDHSLLLNSKGQIFGFGHNRYGQLGLSGCRNKIVPTLIKTPEKIREISAGGNHSLISDINDRIYSFGHNQCGQLGLGGYADVNIPALIEGLST